MILGDLELTMLLHLSQNLMNSRSLKHIVGLTLHDRTTKSILHPHQKKKPPSISAQFQVSLSRTINETISCCVTGMLYEDRAGPTMCFLQASLSKLMETIGKAEPFFIRCIRSNAEKVMLHWAFACC